MTEPRYRVGIDTGGTFTDVVALDERTGAVRTTKTPTTPSDPSTGFMASLTKVLDLLEAPLSQVVSVAHGTTVATNQLLVGKVERLGFVTTAGYEHVLEIARQSVPDGYGNSYFWVKPPRIVPADHVVGVAGRLAYDGSLIRPFDEDSAVAAAERLRAMGVQSIGVCFLHSYANPEHELAMRRVLSRVHPQAVVSISSEVLSEYREYERSVTTLVDAAVKPSIREYVAAISTKLDVLVAAASANGRATGSGIHRGLPFVVMQSNGGVVSAMEVTRHPITTVLSGPAAGVLGAAVVASAAGFDRVVTLDGGGTSTDVALVVDGRPSMTTEGNIGAYPCKVPMIDVVTVGAGGGSLAHLSREGTLKVGPQSAGADPGPMCYATGGTEPTVTDAHAFLQRIPPHLLGGEVRLEVGLARLGIERLAASLGLEPSVAAAGILEVSAWNQANAVRQVTVQPGLDIRDFHLVTFGGSGSLLVCRLLDILGARGALVPLDPGSLSAYGLLTVDVRIDLVRTQVRRHCEQTPEDVISALGDLEYHGGDALLDEGFPLEEHVFEVTADLRYVGQAYEVNVPIVRPSSVLASIDQAVLDATVGRFHDAHLARYGYDLRSAQTQQVEWVNLRVAATGPLVPPQLRRVGAGRGVEPATSGSREVRFEDWTKTRIVDRSRLGAGDRVHGPAVIEEFSATVPIHPGYVATVDEWGNLLVTRETVRP